MAQVSSSGSQKISRYRSQRKEAQQQQSQEASQDPLSEKQDDGFVGDEAFVSSKSRYRRGPSGGGSRPATARDQDAIDVDTGRPTSRQVSNPQTQQIARPHSQRQAGGMKTYHQRTVSPPARLGASEARRVNGADLDWDTEDLRRQRLRDRYSASRGQDGASNTRQKVLHVSQPVTPAGPPVMRDGPPTSDQIRATKSMSALPHFSDDEDTPGCFTMFKRKRSEIALQNEKRTLSKPMAYNGPPTIKPGGGGIVPGTDAPISAVNAGDRTVLVECGKSKTIFPITPTTTPIDIIKSASTCMAERIDVKSAVLIESFGTVGIQRPLRRYEHVRDVMNSWDTDRQNTLILLDPGTGSSEAELSVAGAPRSRPEDQSWFLFFSQKVGKWDKRYVTLRSDGQIVAQKDPDKPKDAFNVCHLSDFDIYTPTQEKVRRKIKPPKKYCFAIKSQQKTSVFESTHDFVHFFCTNDRPTADDFYATIQGWRSWYLVHVMGEGHKPKSAEQSGMEKEVGASKPHRQGNSMDSGYQLGTFKPLIDLNQFDRRADKRPSSSRSDDARQLSSGGFAKSSSQFDTTVSPERRTSRTKRSNPPGSMGNRAQLREDEPLANLGRRPSLDRRRPSQEQAKASPEEFLTTGLLGRRYSQRQKESSDRDAQKTGPFTTGPNLLNVDREDDYSGRPRSPDFAPKRTHSTRAQHAHKTSNSGDLHRTNSRAKDAPKPLVDLTPQYREPPQHAKKGKAFNPEIIGPGGLIDNATSPEDPMAIPPSTDWRGNRNVSNNNTTSSLDRTTSLSRNAPVSRSNRRPAQNAFTGEGLLAGAQGQSGWGGGDRGRGVMDGSRARGPMVDLSEPSQFVQGSLLNKVEREQGSGIPAPVIDRSREDD